MKKLIEVSVAIKSVAGLVFAGIVILYVIVGTFFGQSSMPFPFMWQAVAIAAITGILHYIAFTEAIIRKMRYSLRLLVFSVPLYITLAIFALIFRWFPSGAGAWLLFTAVFLVVFGIINAAFEIYSKITGKKYNESLSIYIRNKSN